ncbi:hypothetical protein [Bacillus sp. AG4(2022)]|uniref:hypothetical protein n=1 Tax=Bacillus sp. AG4(2022) TaxID=2962594 RepID=UPI002880BFE6|nr:hypothetical protein [Bacillus sp. AG4(2022)]MDT0161857.1 hypothetical protein [Bacillus sp. AG4(2022)]
MSEEVQDTSIYAKFSQQINDGFLKFNDAMPAILIGHLYIEAEIEKQIKIKLEHSEMLDLSRMTFSDKLSLLVALGVLPKESLTPYDLIDTYRRKFVHSPECLLTEDAIGKLKRSMNKSQRQFYRKIVDKESKIGDKFRTCVTLLFVDLCINGEILRLRRKGENLQQEFVQLQELYAQRAQFSAD